MALPDDHEPVPKEFSGQLFGPDPNLDSAPSRLNETTDRSTHGLPGHAQKFEREKAPSHSGVKTCPSTLLLNRREPATGTGQPRSAYRSWSPGYPREPPATASGDRPGLEGGSGPSSHLGPLPDHEAAPRHPVQMKGTLIVNMSTVRRGRGRPRAGGLLLSLALALTLAACGVSAAPAGELGQAQQVLAACPKDTRLASKVDIDVSGSTRTATLEPERSNAVADMAARTAICGGHLRVTAFSASSSATVVLYDGELSLPGATDNARLRRVPDLVKAVMATVGGGYGAKIGQLSPGGSDILAQYRLAAEYLQQLGAGYQLHLVLLTDGFQTAGLSLGGAPLTTGAATAMVANIDVPALPGASITVAGIGKVVGQPPSSDVVDGVVAFYDAVCKKTQAASCLSVTDYTSAAR